jgi:HSP20 family protein
MPHRQDRDHQSRSATTSLERSPDTRRHPSFDPARRWLDAFDRFAYGFWAPPGGPSRSSWLTRRDNLSWMPEIESFQRGDEFVVRADLPGLEKKDVTLDVRDDALVIQGERSNEHEEEREGYYSSERSYGRFYRVVPLPEGAIADSVKASFRNGVLEVTMKAPPHETTRGRRIEISDRAG